MNISFQLIQYLFASFIFEVENIIIIVRYLFILIFTSLSYSHMLNVMRCQVHLFLMRAVFHTFCCLLINLLFCHEGILIIRLGMLWCRIWNFKGGFNYRNYLNYQICLFLNYCVISDNFSL